MSLDVYLIGGIQEVECVCECCENVHTRTYRENLYNANITHNLGKMADKAGVYDALWIPEDIPAKYAKDIIPILTAGLQDLKSRPKYFEQFNSPNGWGMYEHFVPFVEDYLNACIENPDAEIEVSR